jgi:hypothetical protein
MMSDFFNSVISFRTHYSFYRDFFIPSVFAFFYSVANKYQMKNTKVHPRGRMLSTLDLRWVKSKTRGKENKQLGGLFIIHR